MLDYSEHSTAYPTTKNHRIEQNQFPPSLLIEGGKLIIRYRKAAAPAQCALKVSDTRTVCT